MDKRWYHVTTKDRLKSIYTKGIETGRKRRWSNRFGGRLGSNRHVFLTDDFHDAVRWAFHMQWEFGPGSGKPYPDIRILCLTRVPGEIEVDDLGAGNGYDSFYRVAGSIPSGCIENVVQVTDDMKRQLVKYNRTGQRIAEPL